MTEKLTRKKYVQKDKNIVNARYWKDNKEWINEKRGKQRSTKTGKPYYKENASPMKVARLRAGLTQKELAEKVGLSRTYITMLETGSVALDDNRKRRIEKHIGNF